MMYDYGHQEGIEVRRDYHQLYTFKEGDFKRLRLQDIEDMLLLLVQQKLTNLTIDERFDLNVALRMFTRRIFIQKRNKNGISANEEMEQLGQEKGSGYDLGDRQAALSEEVDAESRKVYWWKTLRARPMTRRPMTKKKKRDYYMAMIRNNLGWKVKDFKGMTFKETEAKFVAVWKHVEDFIPMGSKEKAKRLKRKGLNLEQEHVKKQKTSKEAPEIKKSTEEIPEEKIKEMMQLVPVEDVYA
nr:hypothetical protein [Tanacetum cinerariifolium]